MKKFNKLLCFMLVFIAVMIAFCTVSFAADSQYTENLIPAMTDYSKPSGVASCSSVANGGFLGYYAFDHSYSWAVPSHTWSPTSATSSPSWLAYEFPSPKVITKYTMVTDNNSANQCPPSNWTFEGWDGNDWVVLDTRENVVWTAKIKQEFTFTNTAFYIKYRINIPIQLKHFAIGELEMMASIITSPSAPTNLIATGGNAKVDLSWNIVNGATSYNIKRSTTQGQETFLTNIPATTTSGAITYTDEGLVNGTTYYYEVSAVNAGGESPNSNEVSATPTAPQQTNQLKLVLEVNQDKQLSVSDELSDNVDMDWISSDPSVATIDANGKVKALKPGNTIITCTSKDNSYTESINVLVVDIEYQLAVDLSIGGTCRLTIDDLANTTFVTWLSYDPAIATVSAKGKVTAVSEGLTYVVASDKYGNEIGRIYVRVRL